uniref:Structural constituent of cuticle n=1 Tax=Anopheles quadriannulatus TaxID=34691 RepID=A0A182XC57_ANOQN
MGALGAIVLAIIVRMVAANTMEVHVNQPNAEVYHRQDMKRGEFDYGYHVQTVNNQFQHKVKGPDDVTYGCYGYVDPSNRKHLVYYVADRMGYRIIFPNRPTKIFTAKLADSLNKLDGAVKGKDYDEQVVEWNNLYMPESCFRLNEILEPAASNQAPVQKVAPGSPTAPTTTHVTAQPAAPALPQPTQYTIPTTPRTYVDLRGSGSEATDRHVGENGLGEQQPLYPGIYVQGSSNHQQGQERLDQGGYQNAGGQQQHQQQQPPQGWNQGSLPDINPANINLDQFNGHVYPIHTGGYAGEDQGAAGYQTTAGQFAASSQYSLNITQLLAQIEAVNSQVITLNMLLAGMANNPTAYSNANENSCRSVVQLLKTQKRTPQLVYVPILIPYAEGQYNINQPIAPPARSDAYRGQPTKGGCHNCRG